jgi:arginase family enzyme
MPELDPTVAGNSWARLRHKQKCLTEAFAIARDDCEGVFLPVDIDVCDPGHAPGTGTPRTGRTVCSRAA